MIEKIVSLKNIGKFRDFNATGDVSLRRLTLIFAPNGRGKTTLCDVLRSLQTGRPEYVKGRQTLGAEGGAAEALLRVNGTNAALKNAAWSSIASEVAIFDSTFIHENVYAGDFVDRDHKRALHNVIVGAKGVGLAAAVADLDAKIKVETKRIGELEKLLQPNVPAGVDLKTFLGLEKAADLDAEITATENEIAAASRASELVAKSKLSTITAPALPDGFEALLTRELGELSKDAEERVREHIRGHTKAAPERWLADGLDLVKGGECPFCGSSLEKIDLLGAYRAFFGESYRALKADIATMTSTVDARLGENVLLAIQKSVGDNATLETFWKDFVAFDIAPFDFERDVREPVLAMRRGAQRTLARKQQAPLEAVPIDDELRAAMDGLAAARTRVAKYVASVELANTLIESRKKEVRGVDLPGLRAKLARLNATRARSSAEVEQLCTEYSGAVASKRALEGEKRSAKEKLDEYTAQVFVKYQTQINLLLETFGADFRVVNTTRSYVGGTASSDYQLVINSVAVSLGGPEAPLDAASFRNTLSSGDRSTLALAFFLAQLDLDPGLPQKIVVLDDPFTSQDRSRRSCTQQLIRRMSTTAAQVIVLSHDPDFLKLVWDGYEAANVKTLQLARVGNDTTLREWDIEGEAQPAYLRDQARLREYAVSGEGDRHAVVRCIRPVLEGNMRLRAHPHFKPNEWLGDLIKNIREAAPDSPLAAFRPSLPTLEDLNDFSKKYHHQDNPIEADAEPIDDGELLTYVKRTLSFVSG
jgi:wobble nucleotide-excising tRNase